MSFSVTSACVFVAQVTQKGIDGNFIHRATTCLSRRQINDDESEAALCDGDSCLG